MIKLKHITKSFNNNRILDDVSLEFVENKIYAILGASGSGKTTLLNILGLLDFSYSGTYIIDGVSVSKNNAKELLNQSITYIYQRPIMFDKLTYIDNINIPHFLNNDIIKDGVINRFIKKFHLNVKSNKKMNQFSGGELQRLSLTRGLLSNKKIILLDEATSALDAQNQEVIRQELINIKKNKIIIFVTHDKGFAHNLADEIINIEDGRIIYEFNNLENKQEYLTLIPNKKLSLGKAFKIVISLVLSNKKRMITFTSLLSGGLSALCMALSLCTGFMSYFEELIGGEVSKYVYFVNYRNNKDISYQDYLYFKDQYKVEHAIICDNDNGIICETETGALFISITSVELGERVINYQIDHTLDYSYSISQNIYDELSDVKHLNMKYKNNRYILSFSNSMVSTTNNTLLSRDGQLIDDIDCLEYKGKYLYIYSTNRLIVPYGSPYEVIHVYQSFYEPLEDVIGIIKKGIVVFCSISLFISLLGVMTISLLDLYDRKQQIGLLKLNGWSLMDISKVLLFEITIKEIIIVVITTLSSFYGVSSINSVLNDMYEGNFVVTLEIKNLALILVINTGIMIVTGLIPFIKIVNTNTSENLHN